MPKFPTFPTLYDECKQISITDLKRLGFIEIGQWKQGVMNWSINGNPTGSISITTDFAPYSNPYIELAYSCNGNPIKYKVQFVSIPSNLGKGEVWYFRCPSSGKLCRKLYQADTYFLHREAFRGCMYEKQTQSKQWRALDKSEIGRAFKLDSLFEQFYVKHRKKHYAGKPTKLYTKLLKLQ